jgi:hypothetical protein
VVALGPACAGATIKSDAIRLDSAPTDIVTF